MDASTPLLTRKNHNKSLRRSVLLLNSPNATESPLRRSILSNVVTLTENVNDDSERLKRRSVADIQKRVSDIPEYSVLNDSGLKFSGDNEIRDHLQICTKLHAENKITTKVAWKLQIIDLLRAIAKKPRSDTLQMASTSLDIGAKVYGIRVDDLYSDGMKLANSVARFAEKRTAVRAEDGDGDGPSDNEDATATGAKKKKKPRRRLRTGAKVTIAKDPDSLVARPPKLESVFFSTRVNSEMSTVENLFTNRLPMNASGFKFMILSEQQAWPSRPDPITTELKQKEMDLQNIPKSGCICIPFKDFVLDEWDPDEEEHHLNVNKSATVDNMEEGHVVCFDENGIPVPTLDGSIVDVFAENDNAADNFIESDDEQNVECLQLRDEIAHIVDLRPEDQLMQSEYSYNSLVSTHSGKVVDQIWAGPSHWKLKFLKRKTPRFTGTTVSEGEPQVKRPKSKKQLPQRVLLVEEVPDLGRDVPSKSKKKCPANIPHVTMPVPQISCAKLRETLFFRLLLCKPAIVPMTQEDISRNNEEYEVPVYKYENPQDSQYCSQQQLDNDDMGGPDHDDGMACNDDNDYEEERIIGSQNFLGDNLVDAPEAVPRAYVPYALQAKKMDMKKLKTAVWQTLTQSSNAVPGKSKDKVVPCRFSKMFKELPTHLSPTMKQELSCPLAFVALLHLCNEENLRLEQEDIKDFNIRSE